MEFKKMDKLLSALQSGGQELSDLLHELVQYCPEEESPHCEKCRQTFRCPLEKYLPNVWKIQ